MNEMTPKKDVESDRIPNLGDLIEIGQWYWTKDDETKKWTWFGCVTHIGSNYINLESPDGSSERIHTDSFAKEARRESDPERVIRERMTHYQDTVQAKLGQIREITARLGLDPRQNSAAPTSESRELSTFNAMPDMKKYKQALIRAKDKQLPKLFEEVKKAHENLTTWMTARTLPMQGLVEGLQSAVEKIKDRVFNVTIYAGLTEEVEQISEGEPAGISEKLRLFQRMCYMDEECLVNYRHGGMEFANIKQFDKWVAAPENRDRILPWPRCMVAFRVRREKKYRDWDGSLEQAMIIFRLQEADKTTFMYIRNGEQLYRMNCDLEFGEHIFPSASQVDFSEPLMAKKDCDDMDDIITKRHWEELCREWEEEKKKHDEWDKRHEAGLEKGPFNPIHLSSFDDPYRNYHPFNKSSVYYDEMEEAVAKQIKYYNRIALILQGIFDRSEILHPHPPAKLWMSGGMESLVELVYDGAGAIHYGEPPDFEAYRAGVNASIGKDSFTIGQEDAWEIRSAKIENNRWNSNRRDHVQRYQPYGDPGPGYIAKIQEWQKKGVAVYRWERERRDWRVSRWERKEGPVPCVIAVSKDRLFNVSGYKLGDFRQFYQDPRSRAKYLCWAPILIAAEEWHAGNLGEDGEFKKKVK